VPEVWKGVPSVVLRISRPVQRMFGESSSSGGRVEECHVRRRYVVSPTTKAE